MASAEGRRLLQQNELTSLVSSPKWNLRDSSKWIFRYHKDSRPHWNHNSDRLVNSFLNNGDEALQDYTYASPRQKMRLIELAGFFGSEIGYGNFMAARQMITQGMMQYSNPDKESVKEQYEFLVEEGKNTYTNPESLFYGIDDYFDSIRPIEMHESLLKAAIERRQEVLPEKDPHYERYFMRKNINKALMNVANRDVFMTHYERNRQKFEDFGLRYDETENKLIHI